MLFRCPLNPHPDLKSCVEGTTFTDRPTGCCSGIQATTCPHHGWPLGSGLLGVKPPNLVFGLFASRIGPHLRSVQPYSILLGVSEEVLLKKLSSMAPPHASKHRRGFEISSQSTAGASTPLNDAWHPSSSTSGACTAVLAAPVLVIRIIQLVCRHLQAEARWLLPLLSCSAWPSFTLKSQGLR